jgi:plastocyanin
MATTTVYVGDTITFKAEFKDINNVLVDPDASAATFKVYNNETLAQVSSAAATKLSTGVYKYEWTVPSGDGIIYILEMSGDFSSLPQLKRVKVKAKFRP